MRRRTAFLLLAAAIVVLVGIAVAGASVVGFGRTTPSVALGPPNFVDVTTASGIDKVYDGPYPFAVGGGVAVLDCDGDGRPDLYLAGGAGPAVLERNDTPRGGAPHFTAVHDPVTDLTNATGAYPIDFDGDGIVDLVVLR